jgi:hypothetical protein
MFLMSTDWEERFPLCRACGLTRVGSDHCPIILDSGEHGTPRHRYFFFEKNWLLELDFKNLVSNKRREVEINRLEGIYSLDRWHGSLVKIRRFLKGWHMII